MIPQNEKVKMNFYNVKIILLEKLSSNSGTRINTCTMYGSRIKNAKLD